MTQDEEIISNISYTNSDFRSIYPELLDTAKKLTNKWDPSLSNESDPGNILIKEAAIVGDKVNYHVDKNVLECFPLSATQQSSARQIYDLVGYDMHWYQSAEGNITFKLLKPTTSINASLNYFRITAGTVVSDTTGEYVYTLTQPTDPIQSTNTLYTAPAIQGTINLYEINGDPLITLNNLDENLRLYFPQNIISQNGIYVFESNYNPEVSGFVNNSLDELGTTWMLVDNLTKYKAGSKVFKFGLDLNSDNCYIQFPEDVANLIGSGLNVYYTTTLGREGNIKNSIISKFLSDYTVKINDEESVVINKYVVVSNTATMGGSDPETLQEAYRNYKKLIGTYDTLVTKRDYENAIYNLRDSEDSNSLISNALVTDRTTDMNYSQKIIENNLDTDYAKNYVIQDNGDDVIMPYDIALYLFKAPESMLTIDNYNESFNPDLSGTTKNLVEDSLSELKSVQHNLYYIPEISDVKSASDLYFNINDICRLEGNLTTYYKVSKLDASEIESNVIKALISNYNSRMIDFGNQLDLDDLINTIKNADDRIRNVSLNNPAYEPTMVFVDGSKQSLYAEGSVTDTSNPKYFNNINKETLAKMILAGKVQLFSFEDNFQFDFGQTGGKAYYNLSTITTENPIRVKGVSEDYDLSTFGDDSTLLNTNDIFQIVCPNLVAESNYGPTVSFASNFEFDANKPYELKSSDKIKFIYLDTNTTTKKSVVYTAGTIINPKSVEYKNQTDIAYWQAATEDKWHNLETRETGVKQLTVNQSIEIVKPSSIVINEGTPYYIISKNIYNNDTYRLEIKNNEPTILTENEYLLYTNSDLDGLVILGSGTSLKCSTQNTLTLESKVLSLEKVMTTEIDDATHVWNTLSDSVVASENTVISLTGDDQVLAIMKSDAFKSYTQSGSTITIDGQTATLTGNLNESGSSITYMSNSYNFIDQDNYYLYIDQDNIKHTLEFIIDTLSVNIDTYIFGSNNLVSNSNILSFCYRFKDSEIDELNIPKDSQVTPIYYKSSMVLTGNAVVAQKLVGTQEVHIQGDTITSGKSLLYSYPVNFVGGDSVNVEVLNETTGQYESLLSVYSFTADYPTDSIDQTLIRENGLLSISAIDLVSKLNYTFNSTNTGSFGYKDYLLPTAFIVPTGSKIILSVNNAFIGSFIDTYDQSATDTYEVNQTKDVILTLVSSQQVDGINVSMGYIYDLNGNTLTLHNSDSTEFTKNASALNTSGSKITYGTNPNQKVFNYDTTSGLYKNADDIIKIDKNNNLITVRDSSDLLKDLTASMNSITVTFGYIQQILGLNSSEINSENIAGNHYKFDIEAGSNFNDVISKIKNILNTLPSDVNFDWSYKVPAENKVLQPLAGESYFNRNHIYNQCTLAKIDFSESSIKVNPASIK